jgi:hypothetical protein
VIMGLIAQHIPARADRWTGAGVSGAPDGKASGADPEASGADLDGKVFRTGVPLTDTATLSAVVVGDSQASRTAAQEHCAGAYQLRSPH